MIKVITKTKGLIAPLLLLLALNSQGVAENNLLVEDNVTSSDESTNWYVGLGYTTAKATCTDVCEDITYGIVGRVGYDFNEYIGVEGRLLKTMWKYEQQKIEHFSLLVKPMLPLTDDMSIYALLGYGKTETGHKIVFDDTGIAWGLGLNYNFSDKEEGENNSSGLGIFIDYERLLEKSNVPDFDSISVGITYEF